MDYKEYIKQNNISTTSDFEEYLKDIHSKYYMGTDDDMSDNFDTWLSRLDTSELIYYADDFKTLAEQSLVQRITKDLAHAEFCKFRGEQFKECALCRINRILSTPKPKGDK